MKNYKIYTKGLEEGGLVAAYLVCCDKSPTVVQGAKKFSNTIDRIFVPKYKGQFVMELIAAWSGISQVEDNSNVIILSNNKVALHKLDVLDDEMPYSHFIDWFWNVAKNKNLNVRFEYIPKGSCEETIQVTNLALKTQ